MADEQARLRQLQAASRLRELQSRKADQQRVQAWRSVQSAEAALAGERARQMLQDEQHRLHAESGLAIDPQLHEQRSYAQIASRHAHDQLLKAAAQAQQAHDQASQQWLASKLREDVVGRGCAAARQAVNNERQSREAIDVSDAQQPMGNRHGR